MAPSHPAGLRPILKAGGAADGWEIEAGLWWARQDLNLQGFLQRLLRPPRLPFRHVPDGAAQPLLCASWRQARPIGWPLSEASLKREPHSDLGQPERATEFQRIGRQPLAWLSRSFEQDRQAVLCGYGLIKR